MRKINEFIKDINGKEYQNLSHNLRKFIKMMFPNIKKNQIINCKYHYGKNINLIFNDGITNKNVFFVRSSRITVCYDRISSFINTLRLFNVSEKCLLSLFNYHYKDIPIMLYDDYYADIINVKNEFLNIKLYSQVIDYLLINDKNGMSVDYFYYGDARRGIFTNSCNLKNSIIGDINNNYVHNYMRIGVMNYLKVKKNSNHYFELKLHILKYIKNSQ